MDKQVSLVEYYHSTGPVPDTLPIKALLLDDSAFDRSRIRRMTDKSDLTIDIEDVPSISAMTQRIDHEPYDLIMVDYRLTEGDGLEALDIIQKQPLNSGAAIIMISGDEQSQTAVAAFRQGCHDFIAKKDMSPHILQRSVSNALERSRSESLNQIDVAEVMNFQIESALQQALEGDVLQSAILDGLRKASHSFGVDAGQSDIQNLLSYTWEDEIIFTKWRHDQKLTTLSKDRPN